jgi:hypothetical protein
MGRELLMNQPFLYGWFKLAVGLVAAGEDGVIFLAANQQGGKTPHPKLASLDVMLLRLHPHFL